MLLEIDLPNEILEAAEERRLVFFCGAGISRGTGLPLFDDLTREAFKKSGMQLPKWDDKTEKWKPKPSNPHEIAYCSHQYDKAFQLLEKDTPPGVVRRWLTERLTRRVPSKDSLALHKSLQTLASSKDSTGNFQIVTTNYDDRFQKAYGRKRLMSHDAPRLAPPRHGEWKDLTFLHGRIDRKTDPEGNNLILTSGDFGNAYLKDGWAARFVVELFREFTVLFIGYSVNDVVMGYILDAFAAQTGIGKQFRQAYAIDAFKTGDEKSKRVEWEAKSVEPILFDGGSIGDDFSPLTRSLEEWAKWHNDGLDGAKRAAVEIGRDRPPLDGPELDKKLSRLVWLLSRKDAKTARAFAQAEGPPCRVDWLPHLDTYLDINPKLNAKSKLTALPTPKIEIEEPGPDGRKHKEQRPPETALAGQLHFSPMAPATQHLGYWLAKNYLYSKELVNWVVNKHGLLHPDFESKITHHLRNKSQEEINNNDVYIRFWDVLLRTSRPENRPISYRFSHYQAFEGGSNEAKQRILLEALTPGVSVEHPWSFGRDDEASPANISDLADFSVKVDEETCSMIWDKISNVEENRDFLSGIANDLTSRLLEALRLAEYTENTLPKDHSDHVVEAVHSLEIDGYNKHWKALVIYCLEACRADVRAGKIWTVQAVIDQWRSLWEQTGYELFCRLAISFSSEFDALDVAPIVSMLVADNATVLRRQSCKKEIYRFFRLRGSSFSAEQTSQIVNSLNRLGEGAEE